MKKKTYRWFQEWRRSKKKIKAAPRGNRAEVKPPPPPDNCFTKIVSFELNVTKGR